ncbi:MAG TPA: flagellar biosynthesis protein FlhB [Chloroflexota bacterium]|nr:flagellar biosynthesis protein FlhB [Chloroflexota bacterium]
MPAQEKTEKPTAKRRGEARGKGQVAKSQEVNTAVALLMSWLALRAFGQGVLTGLTDITTRNLGHLQQADMTQPAAITLITDHIVEVLEFMAPIAGALLLAGLVANYLQVGFLFTTSTLKPSFSKVNPISGFSRLFSIRSLAELPKGLFKLFVVGFLAYKAVADHVMDIVGLTGADIHTAAGLITSIASDLLLKVGLAYVVLAIADYAFQRYQMEKSLKMTKQEIKEEARSQEQAQEVKSRIRSLQRQLARRRMMQRVPYADVVITNPTHFAVALQYDSAKMAAPRVVAKGQRLIAQQIKDLARQHGVPLVENKPLAQALFHAVDVDQEIPRELYQAVAEVLAFIYRLKQKAS